MKTKTEEKRSFVWLPESLAKKIKEAESEEKQLLFVNKYLEECKIDMRSEIESLDEDLLIFKSKMLTAKLEFKKAKDEQLDASYELWEKYDKDLEKTRIKTDKMLKVLTPLTQELKKIDELFSNIKSYDLERFLKLIKSVSNLYGTEKEMFKFLVNNFKQSK